MTNRGTRFTFKINSVDPADQQVAAVLKGISATHGRHAMAAFLRKLLRAGLHALCQEPEFEASIQEILADQEIAEAGSVLGATAAEGMRGDNIHQNNNDVSSDNESGSTSDVGGDQVAATEKGQGNSVAETAGDAGSGIRRGLGNLVRQER